MRNIYIGLVCIALVFDQNTIAYELVGNYKLWKSASKSIVYDYSGNYNHGKFSHDNCYFTDRGLRIYNSLNINFPINTYKFNPVDTQMTLSYWYLRSSEEKEGRYLGISGGGFSDGIAVWIKPTNISRFRFNAGANSYNKEVKLIGKVYIEGWSMYSFHLNLVSNSNDTSLKVYLNFNLIYDLNIPNVNINLTTTRFFIGGSVNYISGIIFEIWLHSGLVDISEIESLITTVNGVNCLSSSSALCLPIYESTHNIEGEECPATCKDIKLSCDSSLQCIMNSKASCTYGLYDQQTKQCLFFCPQNSCKCSVTSIDGIESLICPCASGFTKVSDNPPACATSLCLEYHQEDYSYICDKCEYGMRVGCNGECCECEDGYTQASISPLTCLNLGNCLGYRYEASKNVCSDCGVGYKVNEEVICNLCDEGYVKLSEDPITCIPEIKNCIKYQQDNSEWICQTCSNGYALGIIKDCKDCDLGYISILSEESFVCAFEIKDCIEYDITEISYCRVCDTGYTLDIDNQCRQCEPGYFKLEGELQICVKEIKRCLDYSELLCIKCEAGYMLDSDMKCSICENEDCIPNIICPAELDQCTEELLECEECKLPASEDDNQVPGKETTSDSEFSQAIEEHSSKIVQSTILIGLVVSLVSLNIDSAMSMIGTMQILSYILLYNIKIPNKAKAIMQGMTIIQILPKIFKYFIHPDHKLEDMRYLRMEYETENLFVNSGHMFTLLVFVGVFYLTFKMLHRWSHPEFNILNRVSIRALLILEWNFFISYLLNVCLEITITTLLNIVYPSFIEIYSIIGFVFSICLSGCILISPIKLFLFYLKNLEKIQNDTLGTKYESLYLNLKSERIETLLINFLNLIRRIAYGVSIVMLYNSPYIQVLVNSCFSFTICYFLIIFKPYKSKLDNRMNLVLEINSFLTLSVIGVFIKEDISAKGKEVSEWIVVILLYISILLPNVVNFIIFIRNIVFYCRNRYIQKQVIPNPNPNLNNQI